MTLILAYGAVLLSFASGLLALMTNQRQPLLAVSQFCFKRRFQGDNHYKDWITKSLEEQRFPTSLRQAVFVLLGFSGVLAILAGLSVLIGKAVITDQIGLGLPWLPWHVRFDSLSGFFLFNYRYCS